MGNKWEFFKLCEWESGHQFCTGLVILLMVSVFSLVNLYKIEPSSERSYFRPYGIGTLWNSKCKNKSCAPCEGSDQHPHAYRICWFKVRHIGKKNKKTGDTNAWRCKPSRRAYAQNRSVRAFAGWSGGFYVLSYGLSVAFPPVRFELGVVHPYC